MASYKIILKPSVQKDLRALPKVMAGRVFQYIENLQNNPYFLVTAQALAQTGWFCIPQVFPHPNPLPKGEGTPFPLRGKGRG